MYRYGYTTFPHHSIRTCSRLWLKASPKTRERKLGKAIWSSGWLNMSPNCRCCKVLGKITSSKLWLKESVKVNLWSFFGNFTSFKVWLKRKWKVRLSKLGSRSSESSAPPVIPFTSVMPSKDTFSTPRSDSLWSRRFCQAVSKSTVA